MKIKQIRKNGTIASVEKNINELTELEKSSIKMAYGEKLEDYETFMIFYNKDESISRIDGKEYSQSKKLKISENSKKLDIIDLCKYKFGNKSQKSQAIRKAERIGVSSEVLKNVNL